MDSCRLGRRSKFSQVLIRTFNDFIGFLVLLVAILRIKVDKNYRQKFSTITKKLNNLSQKNIFPIPEVKKAIIAIEDRRFDDHLGIDAFAILRAIFNTIFRHKLEGASTVEQQVVRIITNDRELTLTRKIDEVCLAVLVSKIFKKTQILNFYCFIYEFSECENIYELCLSECNNVKCISQIEATIIAARLKYPFLNRQNYNRYLKRVRTAQIILKHINPKSTPL